MADEQSNQGWEKQGYGSSGTVGYNTSRPDNVNHPAHYTQGGIETFDILKAKLTKDELRGYLVGNILKYVTRFKFKNGAEDLRKAEWYLKRLIELEE